MSIDQFMLLICDLYEMDEYYPPLVVKYKKDFYRASYRQWAIQELKDFIVYRLSPRKEASVEDLIHITRNFIDIATGYSKINKRNSCMFKVASDIGVDVMDFLIAMR